MKNDDLKRVTLLKWQKDNLIRFYNRIIIDNRKEYVLEAGPGSGKTIATLYSIREYLSSLSKAERRDTIVVASSPTRIIRDAWRVEAKRLPDKKGGYCFSTAKIEKHINKNTNFVSTTYPGIKSALSKIHSIFGTSKKIIFIMDEFHHVEENKKWWEPYGDYETEQIRFFFFLSGTPWREGVNETLPFVKYDKNNILIPDFRFSYGDDIGNPDPTKWNTVPILFYYYDLKKSYTKKYENFDPEEYTIDTKSWTKLDDKYGSLTKLVKIGNMLNFRKKKKNLHILRMVKDAIRVLNTYRKKGLGYHSAAGLIVTCDIQSAKNLQTMMNELGESSIVVTSDDNRSLHMIKSFREPQPHNHKWIISVGMISEGTDIPRLKVMVDLSNKTTITFLIQAFTRVIRVIRPKSGGNNIILDAHVFIVNHPRKRMIAKAIEEVIKKARIEREESEKPIPPEGPEGPGGPDRPKPTFEEGEVFITGTGKIYRGFEYIDETKKLAKFLRESRYEGLKKKQKGLSLTVAKFLIENEDYPEGYKTVLIKDQVGLSPEKQREQITNTLKRVKAIAVSQSHHGEYAFATKELHDEYGIPSFTTDNKTTEEIKEYTKLWMDHFGIQI